MALVPHLLNVVLNIGKGYHRILFSVSYSRSQGAQAGLKHAAGRAGEDPSPDWTEAGAPSSGLTPALPRGLSVTQPHGAVWPPIPGSPWPLLSQSLDLPSFTLRYLGRAGLQGVGTLCAAPRIPGRGEGRLPRARALSQGPHRCSQQLGEISAAVGCQFSGQDAREGREGGQEGRGMSEAGGAQMRGCLHSPLLASEDRTGKTKHEILLKEQRQSLI